MPDRRDTKILAGLRRGDIESLELAWHLWSHRVFGFLWRMCRDIDEAEALTEESFAALWRGAMMVDDDKPLVFVLLRIAYRALLQHERDAGTVSGEEGDPGASARRPSVSSSTTSLGDAEADELNNAMLAIPTERLAPFVLLAYQGMKPANASLVLGLPEPALLELACETEAELRAALRPQLAGVAPLPEETA